ncbi:LUD domain-containing protein [Halorubellus sp. JP-L1]|uniref:LUD domain-containing protein n=1 Tax=Halorubellus sp. JP-L1 TaxID=2715753 RepID=UPI00140CB990|nr:LUD domain-containing protein [Halorubellus sp. JP-L1]NHN40926.1 LUD domain-containing protein [Halorubellus sp. JP-L1]
MSSESRRETAAKIRALLDTEGPNIEAQARNLNAGRVAATEDLAEYEDLRSRARAIKEDAIANVPDLVERVTEAVEANGGTVYVADDAADANAYVESVCADAGAETLVKSKSMTTEEIDVNDALADAGVDVYETDLGEFVVQLAEESPSHLVGPAMHKSREEIADLLNDHFEPAEPLESAADMTAFVRDYLGDRIREADVGMTGANFVAADSGSIALVTNEGNARKCAATPETHVAVAGVEKLVPSVADLEPFVRLLSRAATGQAISQYVSVLTPPVDTPIPDFDADEFVPADARDFHLVLLDNGRMDMREDDDLRETLYCVRCGACSNSCANFQQVGGHAFGGETYTGGIATGWEAGVEGEDAAAEFNDLCTGCTRCVNACPVKIDIPWINTVVRDRINRGADSGEFDALVEGLTPDEEPAGLDLQKRFFGNVDALARLGSAFAPVSNWIADTRPARAAMERVLGVDRRRDLPAFRRETLVDWFDARGGPAVPEGEAARSAVLYPDTYTNHVTPERGKAAVRALEALDVHVRVPAVPGSGRAPLSQGMIETARSQAEAVSDALAPHVDAGRDVVVVEPSDLAMFAHDYERLLDADAADTLADASYEVCEYVYGRLDNGASADVLAELDGDVAYHSHCQQRTLGLEAHTVAVLETLGATVQTSDVECCGMAGSFGYKEQYYDLSVDVGEPLAEDFADATQVVASGTSCVDQLESLLDRPAPHPIELVAPR